MGSVLGIQRRNISSWSGESGNDLGAGSIGEQMVRKQQTFRERVGGGVENIPG